MKLDLLLHNIRSVYNVAAIFRTAECLGVSKIWLAGYTPAPVDRFGRARPDFHKVALGTECDINWETIDEPIMVFLEKQKLIGKTITGLEQSETSIALKDFKAVNDILLIPGTETTGVDIELQNMCDVLLEIKQVGNKESLNVHAATAISLWHLLQ